MEFIISKKRKEDIKARFFEVTGVGAFLVSYPVKYLDQYFTPGKEIILYNSVTELVSLIKYYLNHPKKITMLAERAHKRALKEHTYQQRFRYILETLGYEK
jgi:spore maturation protein CgeB